MKSIPWLIAILLHSLSLVLMLISITFPYWIEHDDNKLSLTQCTDCDDDNDQWSWECFSRYSCYIDDNSGACEAYDDGLKASLTFNLLEFLAIIETVLVLHRLITYQSGKEYGSVALSYVHSIIPAILHLAAMIVWIVVTDVQFDDECDAPDDADERLDFCAKEGVYIGIVEIAVSILATISFVFFFCTRDT